MDCFDGMLPTWKISTVPDANLVNSMLDDAIRTLRAAISAYRPRVSLPMAWLDILNRKSWTPAIKGLLS
ncbi:hypothetical protein [Pectinatus frisingensis]|uniref:hypothetical protein n=1 Tax=Pectinatus frisingensis TaxID=865 RepID=UPI0038995A84